MRSNKFQFFCALAVAAAVSDILDPVTWKIAKSLLKVWFWRSGDVVKAMQFIKRSAACRACPVFYKPLQTCGSPLDKDTRGLGCYCYLPEKVKLPESRCWLDEHSPHRDYGWHE